LIGRLREYEMQINFVRISLLGCEHFYTKALFVSLEGRGREGFGGRGREGFGGREIFYIF
jgi:hypothetical protein